jgi:hypothetical protein
MWVWNRFHVYDACLNAGAIMMMMMTRDTIPLPYVQVVHLCIQIPFHMLLFFSLFSFLLGLTVLWAPFDMMDLIHYSSSSSLPTHVAFF